MPKFQKNHHNSGNIHFQRVSIFVTPPPWVEVPEMQTKSESFLFGRTPNWNDVRHCKIVQAHEEYTKSKGIGLVVEEQDQQSSDGTDGPSNFTDPALSSATDLQIG